jgi:hypothetical protein
MDVKEMWLYKGVAVLCLSCGHKCHDFQLTRLKDDEGEIEICPVCGSFHLFKK